MWMVYKVGDTVVLADPPQNDDFSVGIVVEVLGSKWLRVGWTCGLIYQEHSDDLRKCSQ